MVSSATKLQTDFIAALFVDCQYHTAAQRKGWIQLRYGKNFADELTVQEASNAIDALQAERAGHAGIKWDRDEDHDD